MSAILVILIFHVPYSPLDSPPPCEHYDAGLEVG